MITICGKKYRTDTTLLCLSDMKLTTIPEEIKYFTNLEVLDLSKNDISTIPEHIFDHLINLKTLYLYNNKITAIPEHIFDHLINLETLWLPGNKITTVPISILKCRCLTNFYYYGNPIKHMDVRIKRFIDNNKIPQTHLLLNDSQNVHSSIKESLNNLMRDTFTMDKDVMIKQLFEESPACLQSLLSYLDNKDIHSTLYLTFFEVFEKVWGRIIRSDFKTDLIKRLDEEMIDSECKCFTGRMSRLVSVLAGFFSDISITESNSERIDTGISSVLKGEEMLDERIGDIISSVLNGREMTDELRETCRKNLKEAEIEDDEIDRWLDIKIFL
jgi:hypothetical protein